MRLMNFKERALARPVRAYYADYFAAWDLPDNPIESPKLLYFIALNDLPATSEIKRLT